MRINRIRIRNWRSIKDLDFCPSDIAALIGPNNAGKTNILSALNFILGERWPSAQFLNETDYYDRDPNRHIRISIGFDNAPNGLQGISFSSEDNKAYAHWRGGQKQFLSRAVRETVPLVYLDANRSYDATFSTSQWALFGRIVRELDRHFRATDEDGTAAEVTALLGSAQDLLRTDLYRTFEQSMVAAFDQQVRHTAHKVRVDFRTFDPLNFYKALQPILEEHGTSKNPAEIGSGMRNMIVLALFRAYANVLKRDAIIAIEEPEIYLHPHAQRSLASVFEELADGGSQVFYSTHSASFVDVARSDRIVIVERCLDDEDEVCTRVKTTSAPELLAIRQRLHPDMPMSEQSIAERYRMLCEPEHADAFFARAVVVVEGPTEAAALPVFANALGIDLDGMGITIVPARGKNNLDAFFQLYKAHGIPAYLVMDSDTHPEADRSDRKANKVLTRMFDLPETDAPDPVIASTYAILDGDYERAMKAALGAIEQGLYETLHQEAVADLGRGKPLVARHMASALARRSIVPDFVREILEAVALLAEGDQRENGESERTDVFS